MKIEIKSISGAVLFAYEAPDNTTALTLREAVESGANLSGADLSRTNLPRADLYGANLSGADLSRANLYGASLSRANLSGANLYGANLSRANLSGANLYGANLYGANLYGADLGDSATLVYKRSTILSDGSIIGYKKLQGCIIKLEIPAESKRVHALGYRKCRAEFAKVLSINKDGNVNQVTELTNTSFDNTVVYKVGEIVRPNGFNDDIRVECGQGINFFISEIEAIEH